MKVQNKIIKTKCKICGYIEFPELFEYGEEYMAIPVIFCPTIKDVERFYKEYTGETYEKATGEKAKDHFQKELLDKVSHLSPDDDKNWEKHEIEPTVCWVEY